MPLAVLVATLPVVAAPAQAGLACESAIPLPLDDCTPPESVITAKPTPYTTSRGARFDVTTDPAEPDATFECRLVGPAGAHDWSDCTNTPAEGATTSTGTKVYAELIPGTYTFSTRATDNALGTKNVEQTPASYTWVIEDQPVDDAIAPNTLITGTAKRWHTFRFLGVEYTANEETLGFVCTLNGTDTDCGDGQANLLGMGARDWTFTVAAVDEFGNQDPTPATSKWTIPQGVATMTTFSDGWTIKGERGHFLDNYAITKKKGQTFYKGKKKFRSLILVVTRCPGCGTLRVTLNGKLLKNVVLDAKKRQQRRVVQLASWSKLHTGRLKFEVVTKGKPVIVEGLGLSKRP